MSKAPNKKSTTNNATRPTATKNPSASSGAGATSIVDELSDLTIDQKSKDVEALKNLRGQIVQSVANFRVQIKQLEKDLKSTSKATETSNLKKKITEQEKQIQDLERRREKVEKFLLAETEKVQNEKSQDKTIKILTLKTAIPKEMQKLEGLKRWPIIIDEIGNLKTFYRVNELLIDFDGTLTRERVQMPLQRAFFGLSFNPDGTINDHRTFTIPNEVNRLIAIVLNDNDIGRSVNYLKDICAEIDPEIFETVFVKADVKESGRNDIDRLFQMTKVPDEIRNADYYQFGAQNRTEVPFMCVWMTKKTEIPAEYDDLFGPRFRISYE